MNLLSWNKKYGDLVPEIPVFGVGEMSKISGCSEEDISKIEKKAGVSLPIAYRAFLSTMGKDMGALFENDVSIKYCELETIGNLSKEIIALNNYPLPGKYYVFACRLGEVFLFFDLTKEDEDPDILGFHCDSHEVYRFGKTLYRMIYDEINETRRYFKMPPIAGEA